MTPNTCLMTNDVLRVGIIFEYSKMGGRIMNVTKINISYSYVYIINYLLRFLLYKWWYSTVRFGTLVLYGI